MGTAADASSSFDDVLAALRELSPRPEISLSETPAPGRLAPFAVAVSGEVLLGDADEAASGRLVVLHDPDGVVEWAGTYRIVAFIRARLENDIATDPLLGDVAWSWLIEALSDLDYGQLGGTVTVTSSQSFGALDERPAEGSVELRASWTPTGADVPDHAVAWLEVLAHSAGLPPLPEGIVPLRRTRL